VLRYVLPDPTKLLDVAGLAYALERSPVLVGF
jgi:hypothetical protein